MHMKKVFSYYVSIYIKLMRLDKPVGIYLLLFPTLSALWLAQINNRKILLSTVLIFTLGAILTRSAGCVINDYFDADFDKQVKRTENRPLALNPEIKNHALYLFLILFFLCALLALTSLNFISIILAFISAIIFSTYPLFKRFFQAPQAYLSLAFSMAIPMAYTSQNIKINVITIALFIANLSLVFAYDTIYAMVDKDDDIKINIKTSAIFLGKYNLLAITLCYLIYVISNLFIAYYYKANTYFYIIFSAIIFTLITFIFKLRINSKKHDRNIYFHLFKQHQYVVLITFISHLALFYKIST